MTAVDRFKRLLADALERVCVLEEQLEIRDAEIERLTPQPGKPKTVRGRTMKEKTP